jgi:hypothetical protein
MATPIFLQSSAVPHSVGTRIGGRETAAMHFEFVGALEVTYGNALAGGGGFHRVTTAEGAAAEVAPHTYLWYRLESPQARTEPALAITQLKLGDETLPADGENWTRLDKSVDRANGRFLWFQAAPFRAPTSPSAKDTQLMPLKEIRVVRDLKDVPEGFESLEEPLLSQEGDRTCCYCCSNARASAIVMLIVVSCLMKRSCARTCASGDSGART